MKILKLFLPILIAALLLPLQTKAQEQIAVPLTNPGEAGSLSVSVVQGSIAVIGYDGNKVLISYNGDSDDEKQVTEDGLRKISNNSVGFQISEDNNEVQINGVSPMKSVNFEITVPRNFSVNLSTVNGEQLLVENISGEMEVSSVNGEIVLRNVSGSALVNTVNGDITATFTDVSSNQPMAFTNLNGDIDVTFPAGVQMTAKMKSEWGEVFTDFEMDIKRASKSPVSSTENGVYKVSVNNWIYGTVNGGGPEYLFKSMRGDIYIRKK